MNNKPWLMTNMGVTRYTLAEARKVARGLLEDDAYRKSLRLRLLDQRQLELPADDN